MTGRKNCRTSPGNSGRFFGAADRTGATGTATGLSPAGTATGFSGGASGFLTPLAGFSLSGFISAAICSRFIGPRRNDSAQRLWK
ncbi:MAG: hypothetical protein ACHQXL_04180, partial [Candidatus Limnocylindrales bacterium]